MDYWKLALAAAAGYLLGSISVAVLVCRWKYGADVRTSGSGNAGATNVARVFGLKTGAITLVGDALKTALAMLLGTWLMGEAGCCTAACACLIGHCYPVFFGFRGGKGVTVSAAIALLLDWRLILLLAVVFIVVFLLTHTVSACSVSAAVVYPFLMLLLGLNTPPLIATGVLVLLLVCFLHRGNIKRLIDGTEPKFQAKK